MKFSAVVLEFDFADSVKTNWTRGFPTNCWGALEVVVVVVVKGGGVVEVGTVKLEIVVVEEELALSAAVSPMGISSSREAVIGDVMTIRRNVANMTKKKKLVRFVIFFVFLNIWKKREGFFFCFFFL